MIFKPSLNKVIIVGSGFAGIACALELLKSNNKDLQVFLISDTDHFEYHAALYRVVTGRSPLEVCIPLKEIFEDKRITVITDKIIDIDPEKSFIVGDSGNIYDYDNLVLALGSITTYFSIPGIKKHSFGFKTIEEALRLKKHLHDTFAKAHEDFLNTNKKSITKEEKKEAIIKNYAQHIVVVGAGASGVELSAELSVYAKSLADRYHLPYECIQIDLVELSNRVLPTLPVKISEIAHKRLDQLGVNIMLNTKVTKETAKTIFLEDKKIKSETLIWTAGVAAHPFYKKLKKAEFNSQDKVEVDSKLTSKAYKNIYIAGDGASTKYSGMAQTALYDGKHVAKCLLADIKDTKAPKYNPKKPNYIIPLGPEWAVALIDKIVFTRNRGWFLRRKFDFEIYLEFLPFFKAYKAYTDGFKFSKKCTTCYAHDISEVVAQLDAYKV